METDRFAKEPMSEKRVPFLCCLSWKQVLHNKGHLFITEVVHGKTPILFDRAVCDAISRHSERKNKHCIVCIRLQMPAHSHFTRALFVRTSFKSVSLKVRY